MQNTYMHAPRGVGLQLIEKACLGKSAADLLELGWSLQ